MAGLEGGPRGSGSPGGGPGEDGLWVLVTTLPSREAALALARRVVTAGLAVCAQTGADLVSVYAWQGVVREEGEVALALKVRGDRLEEALARVAEWHPYEVPQLLAWRAERVGEAYARWARGQGAP